MARPNRESRAKGKGANFQTTLCVFSLVAATSQKKTQKESSSSRERARILESESSSCLTSGRIFHPYVHCCGARNTTEKWCILNWGPFLLLPFPLSPLHVIVCSFFIPQIPQPHDPPCPALTTFFTFFFPFALPSLQISSISCLWIRLSLLSRSNNLC